MEMEGASSSEVACGDLHEVSPSEGVPENDEMAVMVCA